MGRSKKHPWQDNPPRGRSRQVVGDRGKGTPAVRVDLDRLEAMLGYGAAVVSEGKDDHIKVSVEALAEAVEIGQAAAAEIKFLRTMFRPGAAGQTGPRFTMDEDAGG